ncbi:V-type proton ATPase 116 kDa subunit a 1-like isoform X2 [Plodia interpunctella]|nr:V-type proton ATPase 116 kDa subunit a 1-like isoform X2 [Plodia interpunctella]
MGYMLRSDFMSLYDLYIQPEAAFEIITCLGNGGYVQFLDMNENVQAFHRRYVSEICRCSEIERILRFLEDEMKKDGIPVTRLRYDPRPLQPNEMAPLETLVEKWEDEITELNLNYAGLLKLYTEMSEMHYVLDSIGPMLGDAEIRNALLPKQFLTEADKLNDLTVLPGHLMIVTGVVRRVRGFTFQMMLWRISHGNIYYRQTEEDKVFKDVTGFEERKVAFLVICQGEELHERVLKVCGGFRATLYPCPRTAGDRSKITQDIGQKLTDQEEVLKKTKYQRCKALFTVAQQWHLWKIRVKKTKAIYHTMNLFNVDTRKCLIGRCWVPDVDVPKVHECLKFVSEKMGTTVESFMIKSNADEKPPTYHRTNKFTHGFQALINAYGESTYREVNPGLFTIITFPFLFAVMFGDLGHGILLIVFAMWMIMNERKIIAMRSTNEIFNIAFGGRYVILMLGIFSVITGFLYNDIFSKGFRLMDAYWINTKTKADIEDNNHITLNAADPTGKFAYLFGLDPIWKQAMNKIVVENSFKMKLSIILGVVHMLFGLSLAFVNNVYFKKYYHIWLVDIPSVIILSCLFLWLVFLMYFKWFYYEPKSTIQNKSPSCAQLLLILIIDLVLAGQTEPKLPAGCTEFYMFGETQRIMHRVLLLLVILCVPIMLFGAPLYLRRKAAKQVKETQEDLADKPTEFRIYRRSTQKDEIDKNIKKKSDFDFGDVMIRQSIHTIEYTLSTVSHTASYLRLWALSLAHAQLSEMLWDMILRDIGIRSCLKHGEFVGAILLFAIFAVWAGFTVSILVVMEGMSAFLHTLRLH